MQGRYFNGLKYFYNRSFDNKREAMAKAKQLRRDGNLARVVPFAEGYEVWDRPKGMRGFARRV